jgi:hypothetical protein
MSTDLLKSLTTLHTQLAEGVKELIDLREQAVATGSDEALSRLELATEQLRKVKEQYVQAEMQAREPISLPGFGTLSNLQYQALRQFAENNDRHFMSLRGLEIKDNVVVTCDFRDLSLKTLEGLEGLWSVKELNVSNNHNLKSLRGIPTQQIEKIVAQSCRLTGDLSALTGASKLRTLDVSDNSTLTSLKGIPTQGIAHLSAPACGLKGDLSELAGASRLIDLVVDYNKRLSSLDGLALQSITTISAEHCGLTGDHTFLSGAPHLRLVALYNNKKSLQLDRSAFRASVNFI